MGFSLAGHLAKHSVNSALDSGGLGQPTCFRMLLNLDNHTWLCDLQCHFSFKMLI